LSKSNQKRQNSNVRRPQFREEQSNERLRLSSTTAANNINSIEILAFNAS